VAFTAAISELVDDPDKRERMGRAGRSFVEGAASPAAVALAYENLFIELGGRACTTP
jgi:glycosyltransferase involved in cell wall biosynthesis